MKIVQTFYRLAFFGAGFLLLANFALMHRLTVGVAFIRWMQLAIALGLILYAVLFKRISRISAKIHIVIAVLLLIPLCFSLFLGIYGNVSDADFTEDVVIVLGAGIVGERVTRPLAHRLDTAAAYWRENSEAYIIVTGGLGDRATITEAEAMARYLIAQGIPPELILLEKYSTSTYENFLFAKEILDDHFPDGWQALVVTNDFHIYRAVRTAHQVGIYPNRLGAPTDWYTWAVNYLREMLAVAHLWAFPSNTSRY